MWSEIFYKHSGPPLDNTLLAETRFPFSNSAQVDEHFFQRVQGALALWKAYLY